MREMACGKSITSKYSAMANSNFLKNNQVHPKSSRFRYEPIEQETLLDAVFGGSMAEERAALTASDLVDAFTPDGNVNSQLQEASYFNKDKNNDSESDGSEKSSEEEESLASDNEKTSGTGTGYLTPDPIARTLSASRP